MNRGYWNRLVDRYEDEIFSVLAHDRAALVAAAVRRCGRPDRTATDRVPDAPNVHLATLPRHPDQGAPGPAPR